MNGHIDVLELLRQADPVPPGSITVADCATAAQLRAMLGNCRASPQNPPPASDDAER